MNIFSVEDQHISLVERTALQYPFGHLATLFESIFAEGIECNLLKKQLTGNYTLPSLNLGKISIEFIVNHVDTVYKIHPDDVGNDLVYWTKDLETYQFRWIQVKVGFPYNYVVKEEVSLLVNDNVMERFQEIQESISKIMNGVQVNHELDIITTKLVSDKLFKKLGTSIRIDKTSEYWPKRIQQYISEHTTLLDRQKTKREENPEKKSRKKENPIEEELE